MENLFLVPKGSPILCHMIRSEMLDSKDFVSILRLNRRFHRCLGESNNDIWRLFYQQRFADPWQIFDDFFSPYPEIFQSIRYDLKREGEGGDIIDWRIMFLGRVKAEQMQSADLSFHDRGRLSDLMSKVTLLIDNIRNSNAENIEESASEALEMLLDSLEYVGPAPMVFHLLAELAFSVNGLEEALGLLNYSLEMDPQFEHSLLLKEQIEGILVPGQEDNFDLDLPEDLKEMLNEIFDYLIAENGTCSINEFRKHLEITGNSKANISENHFYVITEGCEFLSREKFLQLYVMQTLTCPDETMRDLQRYGMFDEQ